MTIDHSILSEKCSHRIRTLGIHVSPEYWDRLQYATAFLFYAPFMSFFVFYMARLRPKEKVQQPKNARKKVQFPCNIGTMAFEILLTDADHVLYVIKIERKRANEYCSYIRSAVYCRRFNGDKHITWMHIFIIIYILWVRHSFQSRLSLFFFFANMAAKENGKQ